jgi:putative tryptophan/tyrosine transport system substrate-binding protein
VALGYPTRPLARKNGQVRAINYLFVRWATEPKTFRHRTEIATLANNSRLPAMYGVREYAEAGGLIAYGPNLAQIYRRSPPTCTRYWRGAKPADLPVFRATKFELVVNVQMAKTIGLAVPPTLLATADEVIE